MCMCFCVLYIYIYIYIWSNYTKYDQGSLNNQLKLLSYHASFDLNS